MHLEIINTCIEVQVLTCYGITDIVVRQPVACSSLHEIPVLIVILNIRSGDIATRSRCWRNIIVGSTVG